MLQELEERLPLHREIVDLKSAVEKLIFSQNQTEKRIEELIQAQKRTEEELKALAKAQRKTEEEIRELTLVVKNTQRQLNGITKKFIKNKKGEPMEVNILGKGEKDGREIFIKGY